VFVGAGEEVHVIVVEPHEARDRIGRNGFVGVPDMRRAVRIGDRGRQVIALGHADPRLSRAERRGLSTARRRGKQRDARGVGQVSRARPRPAQKTWKTRTAGGRD
jgi:hypothetical protein